MIDFDAVLKRLGGKAWRYQLLLTLAMYWNAVPFGAHTLAPVFYAVHADYMCNSSSTQSFSDSSNYTINACKIPRTAPCDSENTTCPNNATGAVDCQSGFIFDQSIFSNTIVMEWELVCHRKIFVPIATSGYMAGMWFGSIVFGYFSDRFGRKPAIFSSVLGSFISSSCLHFSNSIWIFIAIRFLVGFFCYPVFMVSFVYVMEINYKHRTMAGLLMHVPFAAGHALNSLIAYFVRSWRMFNLIISLMFVPYLFFHYFLPESPRWLFSKRQDSKGIKIASSFFEKASMLPDISLWENVSSRVNRKNERRYSSLDLFKPKRMRLVTLKVMLTWFTSSLLFYGLSLNVGMLYGNIFGNNSINAAVEIFVSLLVLCVFVLKVGRKVLLCTAVICSGIGCLINAILYLVDLEKYRTYVSLLGKMGAAGAFHVLYNFTAELYPTVVRSNGIGMGSMAARIGGICTPFLIRLYDVHGALPDFIYGGMALLVGLVALTLPETAGTKMPQTITEAEIMYLRASSVNREEEGGGELSVNLAKM